MYERADTVCVCVCVCDTVCVCVQTWMSVRCSVTSVVSALVVTLKATTPVSVRMDINNYMTTPVLVSTHSQYLSLSLSVSVFVPVMLM